jgi:hypothetical protein
MATAIGVRSMISKHITNNFYPYVIAIVFCDVRTLQKFGSRRSFILKLNNLALSFVCDLFYYSTSIIVVSLAAEQRLKRPE